MEKMTLGSATPLISLSRTAEIALALGPASFHGRPPYALGPLGHRRYSSPGTYRRYKLHRAPPPRDPVRVESNLDARSLQGQGRRGGFNTSKLAMVSVPTS